MKRILLYTIPLLVVLGVAIVVIFMVVKKGELPHGEGAGTEPQGSAEPQSAFPTEKVTLFFHDPDEEFLIPEKRNIYATPLLSDRAKQAIVELMRGPATGGVATIPEGASLNELYILENGIACIDLSKEFEADADGGSSSQLAQLYSIVNSLTYNFPEIKGVKFIIDGEEKKEFGGHLHSGGIFREKLALVKFPDAGLPPESEEQGAAPQDEGAEMQPGSEGEQPDASQPDAAPDEDATADQQEEDRTAVP